MASGFSCASTTLVCSAEYTSLNCRLVGAADRDLNSEIPIGLTGTRIFMPSRSAAVATGRELLVIWRKPLSHILSRVYRPTLAKAARMLLPSLPSTAFQTSWSFETAKPTAVLALMGASVAIPLGPALDRKSGV